ncbi:PspC domain-containing protein [Candidatus Merdisoma sp. HCP28S3_D10]|uniref:PspC domain-containing protein n=1 Tax=unclassified Candidatus Merdisoma TaxID=3099611 RepID=UPI003F890402
MGQKKLYRSLSNRMICGVCGGIGEYFNIDPTLIRLLWVLLSMGSCGTGLLIYIIAAVIIPENNGSNVI